MAENQGSDQEREDLSDEPSAYRLEEFKRQGKVAQSRELTGMVTLLAAAATLYLMAPTMGQSILDFMHESFRVDLAAGKTPESADFLKLILWKAGKIIAWLALPISLVGMVVGVLTSFGQVGAIFSADPIQPDLSKINPISGAQKFLSMKFVWDSLRVLLKVACAGAVAYSLVKSAVFESPAYLLKNPMALLEAFSREGKAAFLALFGVMVLFSAVDFFMQRFEFLKGARLTKKEAKEEQKEHEGDPLIRARVKAIQREMARKRMMEAVKTADVIVTNPTHIAIAIKYDRDNMDAPRVVAKGADILAQKIKMLAAEAGVPLVENVPLARTLFKTVKIGQIIPRALYQAVAEVLAYVYRLRAKQL